MTRTKQLIFSLIFILSAIFAKAESSYDIAALYSIIKPESGTKAVNSFDQKIDIKFILTPTKVDTGKYVVEVKKIGDNLYQIKGTNICIETRFCHEFASFAEEVVIIIDSNYGYTKGKIIFD